VEWQVIASNPARRVKPPKVKKKQVACYEEKQVFALLEALEKEPLKEYRKVWLENRLKVGDLWRGSDRLFTSWDGKAMHPDTITKWFPKFLARHGLPHIRFHALRHTSASIIISQGAPLKNVSSRLGHTNISTTADIDGHAFKSVDREIADKLESLFNGRAKAKNR
jgi:integrase